MLYIAFLRLSHGISPAAPEGEKEGPLGTEFDISENIGGNRGRGN